MKNGAFHGIYAESEPPGLLILILLILKPQAFSSSVPVAAQTVARSDGLWHSLWAVSGCLAP